MRHKKQQHSKECHIIWKFSCMVCLQVCLYKCERKICYDAMLNYLSNVSWKYMTFYAEHVVDFSGFSFAAYQNVPMNLERQAWQQEQHVGAKGSSQKFNSPVHVNSILLWNTPTAHVLRSLWNFTLHEISPTPRKHSTLPPAKVHILSQTYIRKKLSSTVFYPCCFWSCHCAAISWMDSPAPGRTCTQLFQRT